MSSEKNQESSKSLLNPVNAVNEVKKKRKKKALKRKITLLVILFLLIAGAVVYLLTSSTVERAFKSCQSDIGGGLYREINVYTPTGELIAHYEGKVDIEENESGGKVLFDLDGKRYVYYNCLVEVIEVEE